MNQIIFNNKLGEKIAAHAEGSGTRLRYLKDAQRTLLLDLSYPDFAHCLIQWKEKGLVIQRAFPRLNATQREFMMTGMNDEEWDELVPNK